MNRRIRKKLHKGEFNYKGFSVDIKFVPPLSDYAEADAFSDAVVQHAEYHDMAVGGGCGKSTAEYFYTKVKRCRRIGMGRWRWRSVQMPESDHILFIKIFSNYKFTLDHKPKGYYVATVSELVPAW